MRKVTEMVAEPPLVTHDEDLDRAARGDRWRLAAILLAGLLILAAAWSFYAMNTVAQNKATAEASAKYTLAQQVAAACAVKDQAGDLGGLCQSANQIVSQGTAGLPGTQGIPGIPGLSGAQGITGAQGPLGPKGIQGIQGVTGLMGPQGIFGVPGSQGTVGAAGATGTVGAKGDTGPAGTPGADGAKGDHGPAGTNGTNGAPGADGRSAYPFTFTFTSTNDQTWTCTLPAAGAPGTCTEVPATTPTTGG
jgi:hypothetical protein